MLNSKMNPPQKKAALSGQRTSAMSEGLRVYNANANAHNTGSVEKHGTNKHKVMEIDMLNSKLYPPQRPAALSGRRTSKRVKV